MRLARNMYSKCPKQAKQATGIENELDLYVIEQNTEIPDQRFRFCSLASKSLRVVSPPPAPSLSSPFVVLLGIPLLFPPSPIGTLSPPAETAALFAFANPTMGASGISSFIWIPISSSTCATIFSSSSSAPSSMTSSMASPIISSRVQQYIVNGWRQFKGLGKR